MSQHPAPSYRFDFRHGISTRGVVERTCAAIQGGQPHRIHYWLDDLPITATLGRPMPAMAADLIDVCAAVYVADRLALREVESDGRAPFNRWHRPIHLVVPVRHPDWWQQPEVVGHLQELLGFLTDDSWSFEFVARAHSPRQTEAQTPFFRPNWEEVVVALNSGGLDSLLGLIDATTKGHVSTVIPVTVVTGSPRVRHAAESVTNELRQSFNGTGPLFLPARLRIGIFGRGRRRDDREPTQRARAMLFLATGLVTARIAGVSRLQICENGVGAISLPMTADHWGARATRAMHPKSLVLMSRLASIVFDQLMVIENTGGFTTKGDLVRRLIDDRHLGAARHTASCDQTTYMRRGEACGRCSSCILRRVALAAAGLGEAVDGHATKYRTDLFNPETDWSRENTLHLTAMRFQVERLRHAIDGGMNFTELDAVFPELFDVVALAPEFGLTVEEVKRGLLRLYATYVREFDAFVAKIDRPGWGRTAKVIELTATREDAATG